MIIDQNTFGAFALDVYLWGQKLAGVCVIDTEKLECEIEPHGADGNPIIDRLGGKIYSMIVRGKIDIVWTHSGQIPINLLGVPGIKYAGGESALRKATPMRLNKYTCQKCGGTIITNDLVEGTTPFMIICAAMAGCLGDMQSSFYAVGQKDQPSHEWFKPGEDEIEKLDEPTRDYVAKGGLLLRRVGDPTIAVF